MIDRAYGALVGGAIGDAMGMPASFFTRDKMKKTYGYIHDFVTPEAEEQRYHGNLQAGEVTDDTMESVIISDILIQHKAFSKEAFNEAMRTWAIEQKMLETTVIGPSTRRYLTALMEGKNPEEGSGLSQTNGSAMRVAPIGVRYWNDFESCMKAAAESSLPSHGSRPCVAGACAVAAAVAAGVHGGFTPAQVMEKAYEAAVYGEHIGNDIPAPMVSKRILLAKRIVDENKPRGIEMVLDELVGIIGAGMFVHESVPLSLGVFYAVEGNPEKGIPATVNCGDDADTNGAICGNICGAYAGARAIPAVWKERVQKVSGIDFYHTAEKLISLK
ncbi:ADP-ribosylglycohydrolase family protein [Clostridium aminobutyricum]|uniref:ADP-ribosylglycohydrolase family protein n=1 Tax=Clostridium aminobutyricum TaxID=33953 RepID=A0A939D871_CLOAM|nr:ADP-ribosylglycohydrolase family protein [Clostridium aminobutyricum]MBN7772905.1 ADP-ribosylglycohydrolase family protein [Clostridium aminobutyricum]